MASPLTKSGAPTVGCGTLTNPQRACAGRVTVVVSCVCVCVFVVFCHQAHVHVDRKIWVTMGSSQCKKTFIIVVFAKNASFISYCIISFTGAYPQYKYVYNT